MEKTIGRTFTHVDRFSRIITCVSSEYGRSHSIFRQSSVLFLGNAQGDRNPHSFSCLTGVFDVFRRAER